MLPDHEDTRHYEVPEGSDDEEGNWSVDAVRHGAGGILQIESEGHGKD